VQSIDRWRNWTPVKQIVEEHPKTELTKPTKPHSVSFVSSNLQEPQNISGGMAHQAPDAWAEDFHIWALSQCVYHDRCFGGIRSLHRHFSNWAIAREVDPCTLESFKWLLDNAGFFSADGMVSGLILKEDFDALRGYPEVNRVLC
jgi:hypothetical protein